MVTNGLRQEILNEGFSWNCPLIQPQILKHTMLEFVTAVKLHFSQGLGYANMFKIQVMKIILILHVSILVTREKYIKKKICILSSTCLALRNGQV